MDVYLLEKPNRTTWAVLAKDKTGAQASLAKSNSKNFGVTLPADV